jgi:hypothetical protein
MLTQDNIPPRSVNIFQRIQTIVKEEKKAIQRMMANQKCRQVKRSILLLLRLHHLLLSAFLGFQPYC